MVEIKSVDTCQVVYAKLHSMHVDRFVRELGVWYIDTANGRKWTDKQTELEEAYQAYINGKD